MLIIVYNFRATFIKPVYLLLFLRLWHIHIRGQHSNCDLKKRIHKYASFVYIIYGDTLANALIFLLDFLHISETWQLNPHLLSLLTPNKFLESLFSILNSSIFTLVFWLVPTIKWHLKRLSLNRWKRVFEAIS